MVCYHISAAARPLFQHLCQYTLFFTWTSIILEKVSESLVTEIICRQVGKMQCFGVKNADFCKLNHMFGVNLTESIHPWGVTFWWTDSVTGVSKTSPYNKERLLWMGKSSSSQVSREQAFNGTTSKGTCQGGSSTCATPPRFIAFSKWWNDTEGV